MAILGEIWMLPRVTISKLWILAFMVTVVAIACHSPTPSDDTPHSSAATTAGCRMIRHDGGETELCGPPEDIVVLSPPLLDILLSLGIQPAGYAEVELFNTRIFDHPSQQIPYLGDRVTTQPVNLGDRNNPSIEALLKLQPDLILGEKFFTEGNYRLLSSIAPTAFFEMQGVIAWQTILQAIAPALDRTAEAQQVMAAYNQQIDQAKRQLAPAISGQTIVVLGWERTSSQSFVSDASFITNLLESLGFDVILGEPNRPSISIEALTQIETEHILVMPTGNNTIDNAKDQWEKNPILRLMPAVQAKKIYFMDYQLARIRGPIAAETFIRTFTSLVNVDPQD